MAKLFRSSMSSSRFPRDRLAFYESPAGACRPFAVRMEYQARGQRIPPCSLPSRLARLCLRVSRSRGNRFAYAHASCQADRTEARRFVEMPNLVGDREPATEYPRSHAWIQKYPMSEPCVGVPCAEPCGDRAVAPFSSTSYIPKVRNTGRGGRDLDCRARDLPLSSAEAQQWS